VSSRGKLFLFDKERSWDSCWHLKDYHLRKGTVMDLTGRTAIVTGGARGIGASYARALAAAGAAVFIGDIVDGDSIVGTIEAAGGTARSRITDISDSEAVQALIDAAVDSFGRIDILVNNAAIFATLSFNSLTAITNEEWDAVMRVNVRGTFECVKACVPQFRRQQYGKVINISSATVNSGAPMLLHYVTSKGAIIAMTRSMAKELGSDGIRVNAVSPGFTLSETVKVGSIFTPELSARVASIRALARDQTPEDLVGAVVFLASPASDFITGQNLIVDGGTMML
jgi:NAD(P)-dependent dehydrogenase (short-subunit alcohol dehydrogenase family)